MLKRLVLVAAVAAALIGLSIAQAAQPDISTSQSAAKYIKGLQNTDGGYPAFGTASSPGSTIDAVFALIAAGKDPKRYQSSAGNSADEYLATQAASYSSDAGGDAKLALGVSLMGLSPASFADTDLNATMAASFNNGTGQYGDDLFDQAFYMLALAQQGQSVPASASSYVASIQQPDGGWEFLPGFGTDTNTAAMVIEALIAAGMSASDSVIVDALAYLASAQNPDGGFGFLPAEDSDPNSTGVIIQALVAAQQNIDEGGPWAPGNNTPLEGLLAFYNASTGAFQFFGSDSAFATYQAVPALALGPFPSVVPAPGAGTQDTDHDGCPDAKEQGANQMQGGLRNYMNPWDYFNPSHDGFNRVDDILMVVNKYFVDVPSVNYTLGTDRTPMGPNPWNLDAPNGQQRVDDILAVVKSYFHDCA